MTELMYAQMGLSVIGGLTDFATSREQRKLDKAVQAYNNTISALSAAQANNTTTLNEVQAQDASTRLDIDIQRQSLVATSQARVAAGAAGVEGGSVRAVMSNLRSTVTAAQFARKTQLTNTYRAFGQERRNTAIAKATNKDVSIIPKASATSSLLGMGANLLSIWDNNQTADNKIAARLSGTTGGVL